MTCEYSSSTPKRFARRAAALAVAALAVTGCSGTEASTTTDAPTAPEPQIALDAAPAIASWTSVREVWVPLGATDGPSTGSWEPFTGFSHTPQGAALAAITQSVQLSTASDDQWPKILAGVTVAGPGRDLYATNRAMVSVPSIDTDTIPEIVGYTITDYTDTTANVDVVQRFPDDSLAASHTRMVWVGQDWRVNLPTATDTDPTITALDDLPTDLVDLEGTR